MWDQTLIEKYNISGPRYTSYPTALSFSKDVKRILLIDKMLAAKGKAISLYFHIPFCAHLCYYCACNKIVTKQQQRADEYLSLLEEEIRLKSLIINPSSPVKQLHFGGGTPTFLNLAQLQRMFSMIEQYFTLEKTPEVDYSIELDPRQVDSQQLEFLVSKGINRISIGVQDFTDSVQQAIHRIQPVAMVETLMIELRELGIKSINFDLIYGLPGQNLENFKASLEKVVALNPDRVSVFNYAHLPERFSTQQKIASDQLPSPDIKLSLFRLATETLLAAGYQHIGMDHFAKPADPLARAKQQGQLQRNFQGYSTHADTDLIGFGCSAISQVNNAFMQNHSDIVLYKNSILNGQLPISKGYIKDQDDVLREDVIMQLICNLQLDIRQFESKHGLIFNDYFAKEVLLLQPMIDDGILNMEFTSSTYKFSVPASGRLLIRCICMVFDKHLAQQTAYSKVI